MRKLKIKFEKMLLLDMKFIRKRKKKDIESYERESSNFVKKLKFNVRKYSIVLKCVFVNIY